ncbi:unnamed protein product [Haemonchus placei]|uniref:Ig-like domain-containing protein n=1 Tax=Haemonchus placei TaxID=6290 RepID=A0A158QL95_HAEPC|nr:unnamed protein product [Haemonchus placei]
MLGVYPCTVESAARIEVYPLSAPEDRVKEQQLRQQQQLSSLPICFGEEAWGWGMYLQQQLRYEKALEREQIERKAREEENLLIREEQERLRRLFERERAERERLEQIRRREAEEREQLLRQHRLDEQDRLRRIEEENRLRQLQWAQPYQLQYQPPQQQQQQYWNQDIHPRNAQQQQQFVQPSRHDVYHEQRTFAQQQQQHQHQPQPAPRHFQEYHRSVPSDNQQFRQLNQYQKHIETQRSQNMPTLTPSPRPASGPMTNGESAVSATRTKMIPGHSHEHGASLVPSRPPQFLVHPQSVAAKAGETVVFTCKTTGVPPPTLEWCRVDGTPIQSGGKFKIEHGHAGDSKLIIEKVDANDANTYAAIARNSGGTFQSRFMLNVLQARPPDAPEFTGKFQSTTIYEGDSVKLFCRATGDKITYKWFKDNEEIRSSPPFRIENKGNETTLFIENATLAEGGWYRCDAINKFGTTALNGRVVVQSRQKLGPSHREQVTLRKVDRRMARTPVNEMQDKAASKSAPAFAGQLQPLNLIEGQTARLEFKYSPADDPNIKVVWLLNGKPIVLSSRVTTISEKGLAILEINPITVFDQGEYTVVLINPLGEARSSVVINVMGHSTVDQPTLGNSFGTAYQSRTSRAPPGIQLDLPNFHSDLRSHELFEGQPIHLEAKLTPLNDPNLVVVWYLNGRELMKNDRCHQTLNHGFATLDILNATKDDSGVFTCRAINKLGEAENQATVIVHPRVDLHKYEHNRDLDVDDVREIQFSHAKQDMVPKFLTQLQPFHCDQELGRSFFEARISPVNDPSLRVSWLKDGHALPNANRIQTFNNFGVVSLSLNPTYPDDAGTYTCVLFNANGQAQSSAELTTIAMPTLQLDTKHQDSLQIIGYLDSHQVHIGPQEVDRPEEFQSLDKPRFVRPLAARIECMENDPVHFEARLQPANDVKMTVEWYHNGAPLPAAHRFRPMFDFGYVALDILYAYPEDSGTYTLVARNELGEAQCTLELVVGSAKTLYLDPHHPEGLQRIQELEQDRRVGLPEVEDRTCDAAPQIIGNLPDLELNEHDDIHMDLKVTPVNDPTMKVEWFVNDHPIITGSRVKTLSEFGFVALDVKGAIAEDSGTYTLRVSNALGEATRQGHVKVLPAKEVVLDTHHEESLDKINYLEGLDKFPRREVEEHGPDMAPVFVVPLAADMGEVEEGEPIHLECQVKPINDNTLKVTWLRNGAPIPHGHRFRTFYDFGFVSLDILGVYPQDSGEYTCKAENALGSVETKTKISCNPKDAILGQVQHPKSYQRIQEIEAPKPKPQELPEAPKEVPTFVKQLGPAIQCSEGDNIYLEAQVAPADDNTLTYEWLVNGRPLMKAHRFVLSQDFGYIALNILYCYPEDSGTYTLVVRNAAGEAQSTVDIDCRIDPANYRDSFHPTSLQRIKELETPLQRVEPAPEKPKEMPQILKGLPPKFDIVHESQTLHLEVQVSPVDDNTLTYQWLFNGQPLKASSRYRLLNDFGYITLDIDYVIAEDAGKYTLVIENEAGRTETSTEFDVERLKSILADTAHPESLRRIQEIEQLQPAKPSEPELPPQAPVFTQQLSGPDEILKEGQSVHMDCIVQPINDPSLKVRKFVCDPPFLDEYLGRSDRLRSNGSAMADRSCSARASAPSTTLDMSAWNSYTSIQKTLAPTCAVPRTMPVKQRQASNSNANVGFPLPDLLTHSRSGGGVSARRNIYLDTQHESSWAKIQEMENRQEIRPPSPEMSFPPPTFTEQLQNIDEATEADAVRLDCRLVPVNDPTLKVFWTVNGQPIPEASRFMPARNFDYVSLDILGLYPEDSGVYTCKAVSDFGEAATSCTVKCTPISALMLDPQHEQSWVRVQEIENRRPPERIEEEIEKMPPKFVVPLPGKLDDVSEGTPIHLECEVIPTNDNKLTVQWFHNGAPLVNGHRFRTAHDFGHVAMDILYAFGQDSGEWTCVAKNDLGEATTTCNFNVLPRGVIYADPQHPASWERIQVLSSTVHKAELEAPKIQPEEAPEKEHDKPQFLEPMDSLEIEAPRAPAPEPEKPQYDKPTFTQPLQSIADIPEGGVALLEARVIPINDPNLRIQWFFNDQPLQDSNWIATNNDFGNVSLRIAPVHARHSGVYSCKATNDHGAATTSASIGVQGTESLILDTSHPASLQKIRDLESMDKYGRIEAPEKDYGKPQWLKPFEDVGEINVGDTVNLYGVVGPSDDPNLHVEWFHNGKPLLNANRFRQEFEFGSVLLTIVHVLPHDSGVFTCRAYNPQGEATTSTTLKVPGYERLMLDSQHPVSWQRIQELEAPKVVEEVEEVIQREKPHFITQLQPVEGIQEGQPIHLEATFEPTRDPDMQVVWRKNGQPIIASQLVQTHHELGWATLDIPMANEDHNGIYTVTITNSEGEAVSTAPVKVTNLAPVLGDTRHEESWRRIQILEAPREPEPEAPPRIYDPPHITTQLEDKECNEGDRVHFEAVYGPVDDPNLQVQWIRNGQPLAHGSKYAIGKDFGISTLDIAYAYPEDQGVYQVRITSPTGEAVSSATLKCHGKDAILGDTQHAESWARIQEIEAPKPKMEEVEPAPKPAPKFVKSITSPGELVEGQPAHFEATIEPADDANMEITWLLDGKPMASSSRVKMINDFGWVIMDIKEAEPRDTGEWTCVAKNPAGEARCSAPLKVTSKENIVLDSLNPQSLDRIREIEADKPAAPEAPAPVYPAPKFTAPLTVQGALEEAGSAHLQAQFTPIDDPNLKVEWLRDGKPIFHSNRYRMIHDFGFAVLDIIHLLGHDTGEYTCRIVNEAGDAVTSAPIKVAPSSGLILHPQNEQKAKAVSDLEEVLHRKPEETVVEVKEVMPVFIEPLSAPVECEEGDRAHFTARYEPLNDNKLQVGEAVTSTRLTCNPIERIVRESQLPGKMAEAAKIRIGEIEAPRPPPEEAPEADYGPPKFTTPLTTPPELLEGQMAHLEAQITPVADPNLKIEWFHDGKPMKHSNRMKMIHDFGFVVLELTPSEPQDTGKWTCRATNKKGSDEVSCDVKVVGTGGVSYEWLSPAERKDRINELEHWIHRPKEELHLPQVDYGPPKFTQNLTDLGTLNEADATAFVCVLEPIGDPTLRVHWEHNGHPIPISCTNEFGVATLLVKHLITADSGEYKCVATNSKGTAETIGKIVVESLTKVDAPQVVQPLVENIDNTLEGDSIHLECRVTPINDPQLKVQWYRNGAPLPEASRFKPVFEFGFCALDILYAYPEDNGDYELVVTNDKGEARTKSRITVLPRPALDYSSQTHRSHQDNLESHFRQYTTAGIELIPADIYDEAKKQAPVFKKPLQNIGVAEGDFCRFETQLAPINDPYMKIEWFKDKKPVLLGHRFRSTMDFGFVCLDLLYALPDDTGEYTCVATNKYGQAMLTAKLACQGGSHVITESQMPQGMLVSSVKKDNKKIHWTEQEQTQVRTKQPPQFTIKPRNTQVVENQPARFECALVGNPKPKVTWYINGNQALHGHRYKLNYDGLHYLTISNCRISDAGEVLAIARNSEGEVQATCTLDIFQETLGKLGEAFEAAPKPDALKLMEVERLRAPFEPLETKELVEKFTRPRDDQFYSQLSYVETQKPPFKGMELEPVQLKPGHIERYQPPREEMESVETGEHVRIAEEKARLKAVQQGPEQPKEEIIPHKQQVELKTKFQPIIAKPGESVKLESKQLKEIPPVEKPLIEMPTTISNKHEHHHVMYQAYRESRTDIGDIAMEHLSIDLDEHAAVQRTVYEFSPRPRERIVSFHMVRPQPTKIGASKQAPPSVSQQLKPIQGEPGKPAKFFVAFDGALPIKVTWFKDGKEIKSTFRHLITTTDNNSTLHIGRLENNHVGQYTARLENVAGTIESSANLTLTAPTQKGKAPDFATKLNDLRIVQNAPAVFTCSIVGEPKPIVNWFKDGQPLPNTGRFQATEANGQYRLSISNILPQDVGIYECVAKNTAGEARCKARLNVNLTQTGKGSEEGPRYEAPRFSTQIQPLVVDEGKPATFTAKFSGFPAPAIRWYRNNEPIKRSAGHEVGFTQPFSHTAMGERPCFQITQTKDEAKLTIAACQQEDVAEYKVEASNPAAKVGRIAKTTITKGGMVAYDDKPASDAPHFVSRFSDISARQGHTVKFSCDIDGNPMPTAEWLYNGKPVTASKDIKISLEGKRAVLEIARVTHNHAGEYQIVIRNPKGAAQLKARLTLNR